jgi:dTDP-4-dehydrorhamnose reductase
MAMGFVIAGCRGQLGVALTRLLAARDDCELLAGVDLPELDVSDPAAVASLLGGLARRPDVVVNAAAYTHVDRCEREPEVAWRANGVAPGVLAEACSRIGSRLLHLSTDYVFAGDADRPYAESEPPAPRSTYGRSKLEGELRVQAVSGDHLIVRTSWLFGRGRNFLAAVLAQARARRRGEASGPLRVVDDQRGRPTWADDLAAGLVALVEARAAGLYHLAGGGVASWWELARATLDEAGFGDLAIERVRTADMQLDAPRPAWSVLDCSKAEALGIRLRPWREAVAAYLRSEDSPLRADP